MSVELEVKLNFHIILICNLCAGSGDVTCGLNCTVRSKYFVCCHWIGVLWQYRCQRQWYGWKISFL